MLEVLPSAQSGDTDVRVSADSGTHAHTHLEPHELPRCLQLQSTLTGSLKGPSSLPYV